MTNTNTTETDVCTAHVHATAGEVYVISWVELDANGVEIDGTGESIGGVIGIDYADDYVRTAAATGSF